MKIKRTIDGREYEFELTHDEMYNAYYEQQSRFDLVDVSYYFEDLSDEDIINRFHKTRSEIEPLYEEIACTMRRYIDKYDMDWFYAREEAVTEVLGGCA